MSRRPILIGKAEEIDLVMPRVREVLAKEGIWIGGDTARPEYTIPLSVHGGKVFSMVEDKPLDPTRFLSTVTFHGPYLVNDDKARDAERYRKLRAAMLAASNDAGDAGPRNWEMELAVENDPAEFDAVVDALPSEVLGREGKA